MRFFLNGEVQTWQAITLAQLLEQRGLAQRRVAVEINGEIIPKSEHAERTILQDDRVEIVAAIGGG